jgi:hypothetical protein
MYMNELLFYVLCAFSLCIWLIIENVLGINNVKKVNSYFIHC